MKRKATRLIHPVQPTEPGVLPHFGAAKTPLYASSTYLFESAEAGAATFALQQGRAVEHEPAPFNYARLGHPNLVQVEGQLVALEGRERGQIGGMPDEALAFESGMAAITTSLLALVKPGSVLAYTTPIYGGTLQFLKDFLEPWGIHCYPLRQGQPTESHDPAPSPIPDILYIETPANPTNEQWSWDRMRTWVDQWASNGKRPVVMADNTYLGPCWQQPLEEGADLVLYSATKSMSGHSDLVCGACVGDASLV
ncbi:MAG: PLP-dependent transferase, partial [Bacteroidota bacterium]